MVVVDKEVYRYMEPALTPSRALGVRDGFVKALEMTAAKKDPFTQLGTSLYASVLKQATVVVWKADLWQAALRDADKVFAQPKCFARDFFPRVQLWIPDVDLTLDDQSAKALGVESPAVLSASLVAADPVANVITVVNLVNHSCEDTEWVERHLKAKNIEAFLARGAVGVWNGNVPTAPVWATHLTALWHFMSLPITSVESSQISRQVRRNAERHGQVAPTVSVVRLRRQEKASCVNRGQAPSDWACRWLVNGHWRQQWYAKTQDHKPIFIAPYLKGPENKPLRVTQSVHAVVR